MTENIIEKCIAAVGDVLTAGSTSTTAANMDEEDRQSLKVDLEAALNTNIDQQFVEEILGMADRSVNDQLTNKENQRRMNELADYKYNKTLAYKNIMKRIVYSCIIIIGLTYAMKLPFFPSLFGKGLIILIIAFNIYYLIVDYAWHFRRDSKYWDKFNQIVPESMDADGNITLSKYQHNKKALEKVTGGSGCSILAQ